MKLRLCTYGLAILAYVALFPIPATLAQVSAAQARSDCQDQLSPATHWSQDRLAKFDVAIAGLEQDVAKRQSPQKTTYWSQDRLSEFDAVIASLEQDLAQRKGDAHAKAESILSELRERRDAYRGNMTKDAQAADPPKSLDEANSFWAKVDAYLDAVNADIATRQAVMQPQILAWQFD